MESSMEKKYILLYNSFVDIEGVRLFQIQAVRDFGEDIKTGDLGGFIQSEANLSHEGLAWVVRGSKVFGNARVFDDALITGASIVRDNAQVCGRAVVVGYSCISGNAIVYDDAFIVGSEVSGHARVDDAIINSSISSDGLPQHLGKKHIPPAFPGP